MEFVKFIGNTALVTFQTLIGATVIAGCLFAIHQFFAYTGVL